MLKRTWVLFWVLVLLMSGCTQEIKPAIADPRTNIEASDSQGSQESETESEENRSNGNAPADVLQRFQDANNSRDLRALMGCYDPEYIELSQAIGEGVGGALSEIFLGVSVSADTSKMMPFFSKVFQKYVQKNDVYATLELTEIETTFQDDENAVVRYFEEVISQDGISQSKTEQEMAVTMVEGVWYISMTDTILSAIEKLSE